MKVVKDILLGFPLTEVRGSTEIQFEDIAFDSRKVRRGTVFVAIRGAREDGHRYIDKAIENGAIAIVCEEYAGDEKPDITFIKVSDTREALAVMAANYYGRPAADLKLVGITGTNGKTTVSSLLYQLFTAAGYKTGLISTVVIKVGEIDYPTQLTTPDSLTINKYLAEMREAGVEFCFMEASSIGIDQKRTVGLQFAGGVFTNLTHDHLDYHKTFKAYRDAKKSFFDQLPKEAFALANADDKNGRYMLQNSPAKTQTYALRSRADFKAKILESGFEGMLLKIEGNEVWVRLIGDFNAYNLLAIQAVAENLGIPREESLKYLSDLDPVEGRFECVVSAKDKIKAIVDYAHTPDALKNVLDTLIAIKKKRETLITVVGCGGDRDKTKRPQMAALAARLSDRVIFTSDNPRTEDPVAIIKEMEAGVDARYSAKTLSVTDRGQAIKTACSLASVDDIILIAGKGHETYQEINGKRHHFDDMECVQSFFKKMKK